MVRQHDAKRCPTAESMAEVAATVTALFFKKTAVPTRVRGQFRPGQ